MRDHYICLLRNFLSPLLRSNWPPMHHLQQQRCNSGHRLLKHLGSPALPTPPTTPPPCCSYLLTFSYLLQFYTLLHVSSFLDSAQLSTLSLFVIPPLSPFVFTQSRCFSSPSNGSFNSYTPFFFSPIRCLPKRSNKAINLQHLN